jgi:beta-glucosidase
MNKYKDSSLSVEERVKDLLALMTIEEKVGQLNQVLYKFDKVEELYALVRAGKVGSRIFSSSAFAGNEKQILDSVNEINDIQRMAVEESRLGIPIINGRDVIHGHRTVFPIPLAQAASWNPALIEEASKIAALEASAEGIHWTFAPMLDISRDARWGRIIESFGEDPYLSSVLAKATVKGFQGTDLAEEGRIAACAKHFIGYGASEGGRDYESIELSDNTMRNIYLPAFKAAVEAGVATVMSAFHENNGEPITSSKYLLTEVLKKELSFDGYVISDWNSVVQLIHQGVAENRKAASELAFNAGVDMDMVDQCYIDNLIELINEGKIAEARLNDAVKRILTIKFKLGLFEKPYTALESSKKFLLQEEHLKCSRKLAAESCVLLKNQNGALPLSKKDKRIAVIGSLANAKRAMMGSWTLDGREEDVVTVAEGVKLAAPEAEILTSDSPLVDDMILTARKADYIVLVLGESNVRSGEANGIADIVLPPGQEDMLEILSRFGKPIVVVICAGRPLAITKVDRLAEAVIYAWHPGTQAGNAIADILFGDINPSGKLPVTIPQSVGQIPIYYNHKSNGRNIDEYYGESSFVNYHDLTAKPLYPFGFGLSYTKFAYENINIDKTEMSAEDSVRVSVTIKNIGESYGEEVVQCYIKDEVASTTRPMRELKGFKKIGLEPGEAQEVCFQLGKKELSFYGKEGKLIIEPGKFTVWIGGSSLAELKTSFKII